MMRLMCVKMMVVGGLAFVCAVGCQVSKIGTTRPVGEGVWLDRGGTTQPSEVVEVKREREVRAAATRGASDPAAGVAGQKLLGMNVYVVSVPVGAVSGNKEFWKRIDEDEGVTPAGHALMDRNGVRVGMGAMEDWPYFKGIIDEHPATTQVGTYVTTGGARSFELEMRKDIATENLWYYNGENGLVGRTYENCSNMWALSFQEVPREPGVMRVSMSPLVRGERKRLEVIKHPAHPEDSTEWEFDYVNPEYLFDLNLVAKVGKGKFLVMGVSAGVSAGLVGERFMMGGEGGERVERVLLLVPREVPVGVKVTVKGK